MDRDKLGRFLKGSVPHNKGKVTAKRTMICRKCGGPMSNAASYATTTGLCRKCYLVDLHNNRRGRTPNTQCEICGKPLYRRPWQIRERSFFCCSDCRPEAIRKHPHVYARIADEDFGNRFKKGTKLTPRQRREISMRMKGKKPWNKGLTRKDDSRIAAPWEGKSRPSPTTETKQKLIRTLSVVFRKRPTRIEKELYSYLERQKVRFYKQRLIKGKFLVDAYVPKHNLVIEADGDYWHSLEHNAKRDKARNAYLTKCGYKVLRLKEADILSGVFKQQVKEVLYAHL